MERTPKAVNFYMERNQDENSESTKVLQKIGTCLDAVVKFGILNGQSLCRQPAWW